MALVVGIDGDDTLWHNERVFSVTEAQYEALLAPWMPPGEDLAQRLLATERGNLASFGYGVKSFTLSMVETAIQVSGGRVPAAVIAEILEIGKAMLHHPVELLDGVTETIPGLSDRWQLLLITKGDLFHQESKVARSGLLPYFAHVEIVSEKDPATYRRILDRAGVSAGEFVMVGDSMRSDIGPTLEIGGRAVHIPGWREWELDRLDVHPAHSGRWIRVTNMRDVPDVLSGFERS